MLSVTQQVARQETEGWLLCEGQVGPWTFLFTMRV